MTLPSQPKEPRPMSEQFKVVANEQVPRDEIRIRQPSPVPTKESAPEVGELRREIQALRTALRTVVGALTAEPELRVDYVKLAGLDP